MNAELGFNCREITWDNLDLLTKESEAVFAFACLEAGCQITAQIPVGQEGQQSIIDFWVTNPKNPHSTGKLVEVTMLPRESVEDPQVLEELVVKKSKSRFKIISKNNQIARMKASGQPWTILYQKEINNIRKKVGDPRQKE